MGQAPEQPLKSGDKVKVINHGCTDISRFSHWYDHEKKQFPIGSEAEIHWVSFDGAVTVDNEDHRARLLDPSCFERIEQ